MPVPGPNDDLRQSLASGSIRPSSTIGPYRVLGLLGSGAFGIVYRVCRVPDETLALKLLIAANPEDAQRFEREIELARRLEHPGLVRIVDAGRQAQFPYYVMEYCPGETLAARLRRGPYDIEAAVRLVLDLARTTAAVNEEGVIHRDLKPSNVILDPTGAPKITDFGLAHDAHARERLTRTGDVMGTPAYMAPELFKDAKRSDQRADVYALGVILYECLTGECPFLGSEMTEVARRVMSGRFAPPRSLRPEIPPALEAICLQAMARDVHDRYVTADVLIEELERVLSTPTSATPRSSPRLAAALVVLGVLAAVLAVGIAAVLSGRTEAGPPEVDTAAAPEPARSDPSSAPQPAPTTTPSQVGPNHAAARATLAQARDADRRPAPGAEVLALYRRALAQGSGDSKLEAAALRGELDVLFTRGRITDLRRRAGELSGTAVERYARFLVLRTHAPQSRERLAALRALAKTRSDAVGNLAAAMIPRSEGRGTESIPELRRALELDPGLTSARVFLAMTKAQAQRFEDAHALLDEALRRAPNDTQALWTRVQLLQHQRRSADAIAPLDRLLAVRSPNAPDRYSSLYQRARMSLHLNRFQEGIPFLNEALKLRPRDTVAFLLRGMFHLRLKRRALAAADYRAAALAKGQRVFEQELRRRYRNPELQKTIWSLTLEGLRTIPPHPLTPEAKARINAEAATTPASVRGDVTQLLFEAARGATWKQLAPGWRRVRAAVPSSGEAALLHAEALLSRGWIEETARVLKASRELTRAGRLALVSLRIASEASRHAGNNATAIQAWKLLARQDPGGAEGRLARALLRGYPKQPRTCIPALQQAAQADRSHAPTLVALTSILAAVGEDPLHAIANAEALLIGGIHSVEVLGSRFLALARLLRGQGRWDWIRADARMLLKLAPHSSYLGRVLHSVFRASPHASDRAWAETIRKKLPIDPGKSLVPRAELRPFTSPAARQDRIQPVTERQQIDIDRPRCPFCHDDVRPEQEKAGCPGCMAWHHAECWSSHQGCSACGAPAEAKAPAGGSAPDAVLLSHLMSGNKIQAIKRYRELHRVDLKQAKEAVEALERRASPPAPLPTPTSIKGLDPEIEAALREAPMFAIKRYSDLHGVSLRDARDAIDALQPLLGQSSTPSPDASQAVAFVFALLVAILVLAVVTSS